MRERQDAWKLGLGPNEDGWNDTILWYAKGVAELQKLPFTDRRSWKFLAALHGFNAEDWREYYQVLDTDEAIPDALNPGAPVYYGNQCQHGSWYFLPWHRGYLHIFEAIVAAQIEALGGPSDWALPYWNYLDAGAPNAMQIPMAFTQPTLPDGNPNPLYLAPPNRWANAVTARPELGGGLSLSLGGMINEHDFVVGSDGSIGLGGGRTGFSWSGRFSGDLERNPHNPVHVLLGAPPGRQRVGYMTDPGAAPLDPIFWLHHCNIDRLWEAWMSSPDNNMVDEQDWFDGPFTPDRRFVMPSVDGSHVDVYFTARDTLNGGQFYPTYDDIFTGSGISPTTEGVSVVSMGPSSEQTVDVIGANEDVLELAGDVISSDVTLSLPDPTIMATSMGATRAGESVSRMYLRLEGIRSSAKWGMIEVYVNLPDDANDEDKSNYLADCLHLFGLSDSSDIDGIHGGNGLGFNIEITSLVKTLLDANQFDPTKLNVSFVPIGAELKDEGVSIERISIMKRTGKIP